MNLDFFILATNYDEIPNLPKAAIPMSLGHNHKTDCFNECHLSDSKSSYKANFSTLKEFLC